MKAKDVMTQPVVSIGPAAGVQDIARLLLTSRISAVPVVDDHSRVIGIVSEGDLMRRPESRTERHASWWLELLEGTEERARTYLKSHGLTARDVMTREVVTVAENTPLEKIATLLERNRIKRVPVLRAGKLVGIVSRANLLHGLVARDRRPVKSATRTTQATREAVMAELREAGLRIEYLNVVIADGALHLWGWVESATERKAAGLAARRTAGIRQVENHLAILPPRLIGARGSQ
jgi:CBS domain-containing protein